MLGRYRLDEALGRGGSAAVYRGRDVRSGRPVAVKVLAGLANAAHGADPHTGKRGSGPIFRQANVRKIGPDPLFLHELSHPNIAAVYDRGRRNGSAYIVMEYAEGRDLRVHTRRGRLLPLATVLSIGARVADALAHAHSRGVVHGDVKPANIVFDSVSDSVKLIDFADDGPWHAAVTPAYAAPEQLRGMAASAASDQFSLGVTLYALATGELPFAATSRPLLAHAIVNEPHRDARAVDPTLPAALAALLDRALAKRPAARYACAGELAAAIRALTPLPGGATASAA